VPPHLLQHLLQQLALAAPPAGVARRSQGPLAPWAPPAAQAAKEASVHLRPSPQQQQLDLVLGHPSEGCPAAAAAAASSKGTWAAPCWCVVAAWSIMVVQVVRVPAQWSWPHLQQAA
jgi:hypothetical protein